jgi:pyruvate/2-oxoglutarate dehydrogenase complex dihydrolipoamide acyltransferase (E2) component
MPIVPGRVNVRKPTSMAGDPGDTLDPLVVPDLGDQVDAATLIRWLVTPGDTVREGEPIAEVEAEKVNVEIPAPRDVHVVALVAHEGDRVAVGQTIARTRPA